MSKGARHLNRKLVLESRVLTADDAGGQTVDWVAEGTLWAEVKLQRGAETRVSKRDLSTVNYTLFVRAAPIGSPRRPRPDQRFSEDGRIFSILAVGDDDPEGKYLRVWVQEGARA